MAEMILMDSGLMVDEGKPREVLEASPDFDPAIHKIVDSGQIFTASSTDCTKMRSPNREVWFYFPFLNRFFRNERTEHSIQKAARRLFAARWEEIEDVLEELGPLQDCLDDLDITKLKRKIARALSKELITPDEVSCLLELVSHINGSP